MAILFTNVPLPSPALLPRSLIRRPAWGRRTSLTSSPRTAAMCTSTAQMTHGGPPFTMHTTQRARRLLSPLLLRPLHQPSRRLLPVLQRNRIQPLPVSSPYLMDSHLRLPGPEGTRDLHGGSQSLEGWSLDNPYHGEKGEPLQVFPNPNLRILVF